MAKILDDNLANQEKASPKEATIDRRIALVFFILFIVALYGQSQYGTSETALVEGSYVWMPLLVVSISANLVPPLKSIFYGCCSLPLIYFFYEAIWPAL